MKPLRLWPGVTIVALQFLLRYALPAVLPEAKLVGLLAGLAGGLLLLIWWAFFSRAPRWDRWGAVAGIVAAMAVTSRLNDVSVRTGAQGMLFPILAIPVLSLVFVASVALGRRLADGPRRAVLAGGIVLACAFWPLLKTGGFTGNFENDLSFRWSPTPEDRLLASAPPVAVASAAPRVEPPPSAPAPSTPTVKPAPPADPVQQWTGFRGPRRDGVVTGLKIAADWTASPPKEVWRRTVGPGWSSFAVAGDLFYTQEQRGPDEIVACYRVSTGEPVWAHRDAARFWESNAGAGPRGTPALGHGKVYALGATGILNALDAADGSVAWTRNVIADTGAKVPGWGVSGSPLIAGDAVIIAASGHLAAFDAATGAVRWKAPARGPSYSSPHLARLDGVDQAILMTASGAIGVAPADGSVLWEHDWKAGHPIVQPALAGGGVLISGGDGSGTRRLAVSRSGGAWEAKEVWTSNGLKPNFNDFAVHKDHAYGFDGSILACIGLADGTRKWKGGRYGNGQLLLLADQDLMVVLSEEGEIALVKAEPGGYEEVGKVKAIEGKTWNHPAMAGNVLLVRNGEEMAAFRVK